MNRVTVILFLFISANLHSQGDRVNRLMTEGQEILITNASPGSALAIFLQAWEESSNSYGKPRYAEIGNLIGDIYAEERLFQQALVYYTMVEAFQSSGSGSFDVLLLEKIARSHGQLGKIDTSEAFFRRVIDYYDQLGNTTGKINSLVTLIDLSNEHHHYERAIELNQELKSFLELQNRDKSEIAVVVNNIGYCHNNLKDFASAVTFFEAARINLPDDHDRNVLDINLGIAHFNAGDLETSIDYLEGVRKDRNMQLVKSGEVDQILSNVHLQKGDLQNALIHQNGAEKLASDAGNLSLLSDAYYTGAQVHTQLFEFETALDYYQKYFKLRDSLSIQERLRQQQFLQQQQIIERTEKEVKLLLINQEVQDLTISQLELERQKQKLELDNLKLDSARQVQELELLKTQNDIQQAQIRNDSLENERNLQKLEITRQQLVQAENEKQLADLREIEKSQELALERQNTALSAEQSKSALLEKAKEIDALEIESRKTAQRNLLIGLLLVAGLFLAIYFLYRNKNKDHKKLTQAYSSLEIAQNDLHSARDRIRNLLSQQVSGAVAAELLSADDDQKVARRFVCIMFLDIRDYTGFAEGKSPEEIISYQNKVFGSMIKTITEYGGIVNQILGDGFMATFGAPTSSGNDCLAAYRASREIMRDVKHRSEIGEIPHTRIGIGLHAGYVVAGNVGTKERKQYSITGNTVILAARLEQLNKQYNSNLVLSREVYDELPESEQEDVSFENVMVKGRSEPIAVASFTS